ncbi:MAG: amidohydrolase family protein [Acetobacteraceae bacterium]
MSERQNSLTRRELLAGAGLSAATLLLTPSGTQAQTVARRPVVFTHTTLVTPDATHADIALAVAGDRIAAIDSTERILRLFPNADLYDGRGKAILPGLINCHAHMAAVLERGFNEDFGFPNSLHLAIPPGRLLRDDEHLLMIKVAALEAIRTGTTTIVQIASGILDTAPTLAASGLRCVLAESVSDAENVHGPMTPAVLANMTQAPRFSQQQREQGMQRIEQLFNAWHGKDNGRISVFPACSLSETSSPQLLQAVHEFAERLNLGYTIHLSQSTWEVSFMKKWHGLSPPAFLDRAGFLGPRLFAAHCRYVDDADIALLGRTGTIISHQANMAANRGVIPPIAKLRVAGSTIAYGTDNNTNDVFSVMKIALLTERISHGSDPIPGTRPQPEDMLADCTLGGATAVNQTKTLGLLQPGRKADLIVIDTMKPYLLPAGRILSAIIHCGNSSDVESVMVDGRFVMRNNKVLTMDEDAILTEAAKVSHRVWSQVQKDEPILVPREPRPRMT